MHAAERALLLGTGNHSHALSPYLNMDNSSTSANGSDPFGRNEEVAKIEIDQRSWMSRRAHDEQLDCIRLV